MSHPSRKERSNRDPKDITSAPHPVVKQQKAAYLGWSRWENAALHLFCSRGMSRWAATLYIQRKCGGTARNIMHLTHKITSLACACYDKSTMRWNLQRTNEHIVQLIEPLFDSFLTAMQFTEVETWELVVSDKVEGTAYHRY